MQFYRGNSMSQCYTLAELADLLGAELRGDGNCAIHGLATLQDAEQGQVSFLANPAYQRFLDTTRASAVILAPKLADQYGGNRLLLDNPYLGYARLSAILDSSPRLPAGVHPSAVVAESAQLHPSVAVGPGAVIGEAVVIGAGSSVGPGSYIGDNTVLGENCQVAANATIYHDISIGNQVIVHSGAVIGADGFGFAPDGKRWVKIHQLGGVEIGDRVEVGACTTIDRGALGNTVIADGVIIDNHVMIAHNVRIGENTAMAAFVGISGSTEIGANGTWAGRAGCVGHVKIADNVNITGATVVSKSLPEPGAYSSGTAMSPYREWRRNAARFNQLDDMSKRLRKLEKQLGSDD